MTQDPTQQGREAFEKWAIETGINAEAFAFVDFYANPLVQRAWMAWQARQPEIDALKKRVAELEQTFRHYHVRSDNGDQCAQCKRDLRDAVHTRSTPTPVASHE